MRLAAVAKARALAILELNELNIGGKIRFMDCVAPIVKRYDFAVFPQKPDEFDLEDKGVRFGSGKAGELAIDSLVIYSGAIFVDTFASTADSKRILLDLLEWGRDELGLSFSPAMIRRWGYISHILFFTDFPLLASISSPLQKLAQKTSAVTEELFNGLVYEPSSITIGHDPTARKNAIAGFLIQHRVNSPFSENKYFSEAPLPTDLHIRFLEEFEADVLESRK